MSSHSGKAGRPEHSLEAKAVRGIQLMVALQIATRVITFGLNTFVLRHVAPEVLGGEQKRSGKRRGRRKKERCILTLCSRLAAAGGAQPDPLSFA